MAPCSVKVRGDVNQEPKQAGSTRLDGAQVLAGAEDVDGQVGAVRASVRRQHVQQLRIALRDDFFRHYS